MSVLSDLPLRSVAPTFALVAALHAGLAYAMAYALAPDRDPRPLPAIQVSLIARHSVAPQPPVQHPLPKAKPTRESVVEPEPVPDSQAQSPPLPEPPAPSAPVAEAPAEPIVEPVYRMTSLNNPPPGYPSAARRRGQEGTVVVSAEVLTSGTCGSVVMKRSSGHSLLDQAAIEAVKKWRFLPARRGREPVIAWVEVPITFRLDQYANR